MAWEVEFTDEFERWWVTLDGEEQDAIDVVVGLLEEKGPQLSFPHSSKVTTSRHGHLRELRVQYRGEPYRILYAFDPRRVALVLVGGSKTGDDRWYEKHVPMADALYDEHLEELRREGLIDGT
ncbi:MAG: type II toxin-antitoxin system RelE/ParE family toxin [Longimicrobiales bacterium]